jgi:MoaA/NifB/PqqE/SkfB family radical SAM enzyme
MPLELISIELTNRCAKACWFCYNHSAPEGETRWQLDEVLAFVRDCAANGVKAVSLGGGEPLQYPGVFALLNQLDGALFRSVTTNGLLLHGDNLDRLVAANPNKVHVSIHFPERANEVARVICQVHELASRGVRSGVNFLVTRSNLPAASDAAQRVRDAGIGNDRIVYLPMRGRDTPTPSELAEVAGRTPFQSMTCLTKCGPSPRFASIGWDKSIAWCSYTAARRRLPELTFAGLTATMNGLGLEFCGGTEYSDPPSAKQELRIFVGS